MAQDEINMLEDAEFENQMNALGDDQPALIKFVARQQFATSKVLITHGRKIKALERRSNRTMGIIGGTGTLIGAVIASIFEYFIKRPG